MRKPVLAALLLALVTFSSGCGLLGKKDPAVSWNGKALEGARFYEREMGKVTVHYAPPTLPDQAEKVGDAAQRSLENQVRWGRIDGTQRLHVWVAPGGYRQPQELERPGSRPIRAVGPYQVLAPESVLNEAHAGGLGEAVALAVTQPEGSPAFAVDWLHAGMGRVLASDWNGFPAKPLTESDETKNAAAAFARVKGGPTGEEALAYERAAAALASLIMDRWGVNWTEQYRQEADELTPSAAVQWAAGASDEARAVALWQERIDFLTGSSFSRLGLVNASSQVYIPTMADLSPVRVAPELKGRPPGPGPMANYSPHAYEITARYEPSARTLAGEERLVWENREGIPVDTLYFNLWPNAEQYARFGGGIRVDQVTVNGAPVGFAARALDLAVPLGRSVQQGERVAVEIRFTTRVPNQHTVRVFGQEGGDRFHLAHWFPILAVLDDRGWNLTPLPTSWGEPYSESSSFRVKLNVPAGTVVGATGEQVARLEEGDRWVYEYDAPNVKDWVATGGSGLHEVIQEVEGVKIRVIDHDEQWAKTTADVTARTLPIFNRKFGPYAYKELVITCCAGLEYPGLFFSSRRDQREFWRVVIYHELAHQWFYGMVGNDQWGEPWLDEGFARYGERVGVKALGPASLLGNLRAGNLLNLLRVSSSSSDYNVNTGYYAMGVYNKGALVLEDLEEMLGEERFGQLIREWVARYKFKTATTADFVRLAEEFAGRDLGGFFRDHGVDPGDRAPYRAIYPLGRTVPR